MIEIVTKEHYRLITDLFTSAEENISIISPFLSENMADLLCEAAERGLTCSFITRFYLQDFIDGSNSIQGLQRMLSSGVELKALVGLHTKLYLFDSNEAIVGSANFTNGGLLKNVELSLYLSKEDDVVSNLREYFNNLSNSIQAEKDGQITQNMIDEVKEKYERNKLIKKEPGETTYYWYVMGAVLDRRGREISNNSKIFQEELELYADERSSDIVFSSLGGCDKELSYKVPRNTILKFLASSKNRYDEDVPMYMNEFVDNGKKIYISNFSLSRKNDAESIEDEDEVFFCVHSKDASGDPSPMIVGYGLFKKYNYENDVRRKSWANSAEWLKDYPLYCVVKEAHILNTPVKNGIPLREMINELGYLTYIHTRNNPDQYPRERVIKSHAHQAMLHLTPEARDYLYEKLNKLGRKYGWSKYKSE